MSYLKMKLSTFIFKLSFHYNSADPPPVQSTEDTQHFLTVKSVLYHLFARLQSVQSGQFLSQFLSDTLIFSRRSSFPDLRSGSAQITIPPRTMTMPSKTPAVMPS